MIRILIAAFWVLIVAVLVVPVAAWLVSGSESDEDCDDVRPDELGRDRWEGGAP